MGISIKNVQFVGRLVNRFSKKFGISYLTPFCKGLKSTCNWRVVLKVPNDWISFNDGPSLRNLNRWKTNQSYALCLNYIVVWSRSWNFSVMQVKFNGFLNLKNFLISFKTFCLMTFKNWKFSVFRVNFGGQKSKLLCYLKFKSGEGILLMKS